MFDFDIFAKNFVVFVFALQSGENPFSFPWQDIGLIDILYIFVEFDIPPNIDLDPSNIESCPKQANSTMKKKEKTNLSTLLLLAFRRKNALHDPHDRTS